MFGVNFLVEVLGSHHGRVGVEEKKVEYLPLTGQNQDVIPVYSYNRLGSAVSRALGPRTRSMDEKGRWKSLDLRAFGVAEQKYGKSEFDIGDIADEVSGYQYPRSKVARK